MSDKPMQNTDRELWCTTEGDYYSKHKIYISESGNALTICEGGSCITRTVETWFALQSQPQAPEAGVDIHVAISNFEHIKSEALEYGMDTIARWCNEGLAALGQKEADNG